MELKPILRYTYKLSSFEQDVVILSQLPAPEEYGLDAETTRLEIWTEFVDAPDSTVNTVFLKPETDPQNPKGGVDPYLSDDEVNFGEASLAGGSAFSLEDELADPFQAPILVGKTWTTIAGRRFLIEKVDYMDVAAQLARLPKSAAIQSLPKGRKEEAHPAKLRETLLASLAKPARKP